MMYSPGRFVFVHIPRTAGYSITQAVASHLMDCGGLQVNTLPQWSRGPEWCHSRACDLLPRIPDWDRIYRFSVMRSPWEIVASWWRWTQTHIAAMPGQCPVSPAERLRWLDLKAASCMTFPEWVEWSLGNYSGFDGFWHFHAMGPRGGDLGVEAVQFETLEDAWPALCERIGFPEPAELPHVNRGEDSPVEWTEESVGLIAERCRGDVERFGYGEP